MPIVTAGFPLSTTPVPWSAAPWLRTCQTIFQNAVAVYPNVPSANGEQFAPEAIAAGKHCLQRLGDGDTLPPDEWGFLLRFAVALNDDSLIQRVVTRQLAAAKVSAHDRATILKNTIHLLLHDQWREVDQATETPISEHRTAAHVALARRYSAELDTMHPAGAVLRTRMEVYEELVKLDQSPWSADSQLARMQYRLHLAQSVPLAEIPTEDQPSIRQALHVLPLRLAEAVYLKTPTHANLLQVVAARDTMLGSGNGLTVDSLLAHPVSRLAGDFWFNTSGQGAGQPIGQTPGVIPAPGTLTLVVFVDALQARNAVKQGDLDERQRFATLATQLARLHTQYPTVQIILVALTAEVAQLPGQPDDPAEDAEFISDLLTRQLRLPGILCVLRSRYHTEAGQTAIPLPSPVLDGFHLDPRSYGNHVFLIDTAGWIVDTHADALDGHLIQRLLSFKESSSPLRK